MKIKSLSVLVVEETELMRKMLSEQLRQFGYGDVIQASNGQKAIEVLKEYPISLIVSGLELQKINGIQLLNIVRGSNDINGISFLMVTSEANKDTIKTIIQAGVSELLVKPFSAAILKQKLIYLEKQSYHPCVLPSFDKDGLDKITANATSIEQKSVIKENTNKILIVDDTTENLTLIRGLLKDDYHVIFAKNGKRALKLCAEDTPPDLILLDILMPEMDGFEVLKRIRENPMTEHIPVIFVTALSQQDDEIKGLEYGAVDYIKKPIQPTILKLRIKSLLAGINLRKSLQHEYDQMLQESKSKQHANQMLFDELRRPLEVSSKMLNDMSFDRKINEYVRDKVGILQSLTCQTALVLDQSKALEQIEMGQYTPERKRFSLHSLLATPLSIMQEVYKNKSLLIYSEPDEDIDNQFSVRGDQKLAQIIIFNILKNACHAASTRSRVSLKLSNHKRYCCIQIENTGAVSQEMRDIFWQKYATSDANHNLGFGTYIMKLMTEIQKGKIEMAVDDELNTTTISLYLPL
ncbi:response regulator [Vibrio lamellibrachiae]|uniref:response regulator n=1 Tax=Vibrio lamellibrachiae TaxID=2910253 RepID=UPI003D0C3B6A